MRGLKNSVCCGTLAPFVLLCPAAEACEDKYPPVVKTPVTQRVLCDAGGQAMVEMALDPRGVSRVRPVGEPAATLTRSSDDSGVWHYREWQWWRGHPWGDSCRPRYWTTAEFLHKGRDVGIRFRIDGFACEQRFVLPLVVDAHAPYWDVVVSIENVSGVDVEEYHQFFACYTEFNDPNSFWFWAEDDRLRRFAEFGVEHLDGYVVHPQAYYIGGGAIPHCPRGNGKIVATWHRPVMISHPSPGGWRSVILIGAEHAASLAQGIRGGAMDYILFPGPDAPTFADRERFDTHVRHQLIKSPELPPIATLAQLWDDFQSSHREVHRLANESRAK